MRKIGTQPIETERLLLRRFAPEDAAAIFVGWANNPAVTRWMRWMPHTEPSVTQEILDTWVANYAKPDYYHWAVQRKDDGALMGAVGIFASIEEDTAGSWEPGYCYGRAFWGQGYATEALRAVMDYFVQNTDITDITCCHAKGNPASGRVMQNAGFTLLRETVYHGVNHVEIPALLYRLEPSPRKGTHE